MKNKIYWVIFLSLFLIGFTPANEKVVDVKHEVTAMYVDDGSLPSIQAKGDVVRVAALGSWVTDENDDINHVISLKDTKVNFRLEYYGYKADEVMLHVTLLGPTKQTQSSPWLPVQKGFVYKSTFSWENLNIIFFCLNIF